MKMVSLTRATDSFSISIGSPSCSQGEVETRGVRELGREREGGEHTSEETGAHRRREVQTDSKRDRHRSRNKELDRKRIRERKIVSKGGKR